MNKVISVMTHVIYCLTFPPYKFQKELKINKKIKIINGSKKKTTLFTNDGTISNLK